MSVEVFLRELQDAFSRYDLEKMLSLYSPPLSIIHETGTVLVETPEDLRQRAVKSLQALQKAGIVFFEIKLISEIAVGANLTLVRYQSTRHYRDKSQDLPAFEAIVLRERDGKLGITSSINPRSRWRDNAGIPQPATTPLKQSTYEATSERRLSNRYTKTERRDDDLP